MKNLYSFLTVTVILVLNGSLHAQDLFSPFKHLFTLPKSYHAYPADGPVNIDGKPDEKAWDNAAWSDNFVDIEGDKKGSPSFKSRFKILWDAQYMYVAVEMEEPHIWAKIKRQDAVIYYDNDIELFLDPDGDTHNYFELELNANNTAFDLFMPKPYRNGGLAVHNWDIKKLRSAVSVRGTLNRSNDTDTSWCIEIAIPFESVSLGSKIQVPKEGTTWRVNFSRVQWDTDIINGRYVKRVDKNTGRFLPEHNWVWSPQGVVNMHLPERWGYLYFHKDKSKELTASGSDLNVELKKYLWLLYYKQKDYYRLNKKYTANLTDLQLPASVTLDGLKVDLHLEAITVQFNANIRPATSREGWQINQDGRISKFLKQ